MHFHSPIDHVKQPLHKMGQVSDLSILVGEDGPVHRRQLGQTLQGILGHVGVFTNLSVYL